MDRKKLIPPAEIPGHLASGPIRLQFNKIVSAAPGGELVPYYHFNVVARDSGATAGHINFRVGDTRHVKMYAGHIGFQVRPDHRSKAYAYHACMALAPFIKHHYQRVILTCDPSNRASMHTIERLGAIRLGEVMVPANDPAYESGAKKKIRYEWVL